MSGVGVELQAAGVRANAQLREWLEGNEWGEGQEMGHGLGSVWGFISWAPSSPGRALGRGVT